MCKVNTGIVKCTFMYHKNVHSYITKVYTLDIQECTLLYLLIISALALGLLWKTFTLLLLSAIDPQSCYCSDN